MNSPPYSISEANRYGWGPAANKLDPTKKATLDTYILGSKVVDLGCATGRYTGYIASKGLAATGIDHNPQFIALAKKLSPKVKFILGDALKLPLANKSFDTAVAFDLLEHLPEAAFLKEITRITRKRIILTVPHTTDTDLIQHYLLYGHHADTTHLRTYTPDQLGKLCRSHGLHQIALFPSHPLSPEAIFMDLFSGPIILKKIIRRLVLVCLRPRRFPTNLTLVADL